jgi:hypothetical protein
MNHTEPNLVAHHWATPVLLAELATGSVWAKPGWPALRGGSSMCERIDTAAVLDNEAGFEAELRKALDELAAYAIPSGDADVEPGIWTEIWRPDHAVTIATSPATWTGWCFLAAEGQPANPDSGAVIVHDPRAGSATVSLPGLPWGRPLTVRPVPGTLAIVPGWLTWSVLPVEPTQFIAVARIDAPAATNGRGPAEIPRAATQKGA